MAVTGDVPVSAVGSVPAPRPLYLHGPGIADPVFGIFHAAAAPAATAVLLLPPFGYDDICAYRGLRAWALTLAADGVPVLRVDLPGSGDSGGTPRDRGRAESWPTAVAAAAAGLRAQAGPRPGVAVGGRLGGPVATQA